MVSRFGIVGLHHLHSPGYAQLLNQIDGCELVAVADEDETLLAGFTNKYRVPTSYLDWRQLVDDNRIDTVIVLMPHSLCPEIAVEVLSADKNAIVEKPMANDSDGIIRMISAAEKSNGRLTTPYLWRYSGAARRIARLIADGEIGDIVAFEGRDTAGPIDRYPDGGANWMLRKKMSGGGVLHNLGVHWIDLFRFFLGAEVETVAARIDSLTHGIEIEDNAHAILIFENGVAATLDMSYSAAYVYDLFIQIRGTRGVISWTPRLGGVSVIELLRGRDREVIEVCDETVEGYGGIWGVRFIRDFLESIRSRKQPPVTGWDGYCALKVVEAAYESSITGRFTEIHYRRN